jgi:hypothetical protein
VKGAVFQDDLFSSARWLERDVGGVTVRVRLEPLSRGRVRIVRYERRREGEPRFVRRPEEEGRVVPLTAVAPGRDFAELFGRV